MPYFSSNTSQLAIEVSFAAVSLRLRTPARSGKSFPAKLSNKTSFKMDSILGYFDLHSFVGKSKGPLLAVNNLKRYSTPRYTQT